MLLAVNLLESLRRFDRKRGEQSVQIGLTAYVYARFMVEPKEVVSVVGDFSASPVKCGEPRLEIRIGSGNERSGNPRIRAHLRNDVSLVTDHPWHDIPSELTVDPQCDVLDNGAADAVPWRVIGKTYDHPIHKRLLRSQDTRHTVVSSPAVVHMEVGQIQADVGVTEIGLQPTAQKQGRLAGEHRISIMVSGSANIVETSWCIGTFDSTRQRGHFEAWG